tara:strand:+ start:344 stop:541 length:198 start_codon:yes stop_codon:yes gene_type:complete
VVRTNTEKQSEKDLNRKEKMTRFVNKTVDFIIKESEEVTHKINAPNVCGVVLSGYCFLVLYNLFA